MGGNCSGFSVAQNGRILAFDRYAPAFSTMSQEPLIRAMY